MDTSDGLFDSYGRRIRYLRISITDGCNFQCVYCHPADGYTPLPASGALTRREITRFVALASRLGIRRVRLTGGEPLLRPDLVDIIRDIKATGGVDDLSITTNGSLLPGMISALKAAGLDRLNISLDSLNPARFKAITSSNGYQRVYESVFLSLEAGFPVKLNMVALSDLTREEIVRFVRLAMDYPLEARFLEFMPLCGSGWRPELVVPISSVRAIVSEHFALAPVARGGDVSDSYQLVGGKGRVGFIASLTESFCDQCSRIRLSSDGRIFPCLFSDAQVPVGHLLRDGASDESILRALRDAVSIKPRGNQYREEPFSEQEAVPAGGRAATCAPARAPLIRTLGG